MMEWPVCVLCVCVKLGVCGVCVCAREQDEERARKRDRVCVRACVCA